MIATAIAYFVCIVLAFCGLNGLTLIAKKKQSEAAIYLAVSLGFFAAAYGCARLAGI